MPKGLTTMKLKNELCHGRLKGHKKIIRKATVTNAIYQIQNQTKNSKMGN
jgi:hypothetical protein